MCSHMRKLLTIVRAYAWPASAVPVLIGSVTAYKAGAFSWTYFTFTMLAALSVHSGANLANTYFDFKNGVDKRGSSDDRQEHRCPSLYGLHYYGRGSSGDKQQYR